MSTLRTITGSTGALQTSSRAQHSSSPCWAPLWRVLTFSCFRRSSGPLGRALRSVGESNRSRPGSPSGLVGTSTFGLETENFLARGTTQAQGSSADFVPVAIKTIGENQAMTAPENAGESRRKLRSSAGMLPTFSESSGARQGELASLPTEYPLFFFAGSHQRS